MIHAQMNDECDCSGVFYDGDVGATVEISLPVGYEAAAPLILTRTQFEEAATELFERGLAPVRQVDRQHFDFAHPKHIRAHALAL